MMFSGKEIKGEVRLDSPYLENFDEWVKTGKDPSGGSFAFKTYSISNEAFNKATDMILTWNKPYSLKCMCGTFSQQVLARTGNSLFKSGSKYEGITPTPYLIFQSFGGKFD